MWYVTCNRNARVFCSIVSSICVHPCVSPVPLHTLSAYLRPSALHHPTSSSHPSTFSIPRTSPRAGRPCGDEHRKMRVIKGKIFLCPAIGGCRGNTRATSASNYFQTLRIERALLRTARIARHTHFSRISPSPCPHTIQQPSSFPPVPCSLLHPFRAILVFEGVDC